VWDDLQNAHNKDWRSKLINIYPGVDTERFHPLPKDDANISGRHAREHSEFLNLPIELFLKPHICEFGRSDVLKDKDQAVAAFALVAKEEPDINMFMNLDEGMEPGIAERVHKIIDDNNLKDRIHIFSPKDLPQNGVGSKILPNIIKTSKAFISMSVMEGFGMAACEAAASGVPVIGTEQIPVVTDVIAPNGGGTVVPGKDVRAAADAILMYLRMEEDDWQAVADKAHGSVVPAYTWPHIIREMFAQFEQHGINLTPKEVDS